MIKRSAFCLDREGWPTQYSGRKVDAATDTGLFVTGSNSGSLMRHHWMRSTIRRSADAFDSLLALQTKDLLLSVGISVTIRSRDRSTVVRRLTAKVTPTLSRPPRVRCRARRRAQGSSLRA
jgi:hypothetical protein